MQPITKFLFLAYFLINLTSCTKPISNISIAADYSGNYQGSVTLTASNSSNSMSQPYSLVLNISKGSNNGEINILFGNYYLTKAKLTGNKFNIEPTSFSGNMVVSGTGEFISNSKVNVNYIQNINNMSLATYSGILTKF